MRLRVLAGVQAIGIGHQGSYPIGPGLNVQPRWTCCRSPGRFRRQWGADGPASSSVDSSRSRSRESGSRGRCAAARVACCSPTSCSTATVPCAGTSSSRPCGRTAGPPEGGDAMLAPPLSRLRRALGDGRLQGRGELSLVLPDDAWVDWEVARAGVAAARAALAGGEPRPRSRRAPARWRSPSAGCCRGWRRRGSTSAAPSWATCAWRRSRSARRRAPRWAGPSRTRPSARRGRRSRPRRSGSPRARR